MDNNMDNNMNNIIDNYIFFWKHTEIPYGCFSNWSNHSITENSITFKTVEHYIMYHKALLMSDTKIANEILNVSGPLSAKHLGRKVTNYDEKVWSNKRKDIIYNALTLKVLQHKDVFDLLISTGDKIIAEASPYDKIWGIGYNANNALQNNNNWGLNILGTSWMKVRYTIKQEVINKI